MVYLRECINSDRIIGGEGMILLQSEYTQDLQHLIHEVEKRTYINYVQEYVTYPKLDIFQLHFSYLFLSSIHCNREELESICISQMMIQLGLDSHEDVGLDTVHDERKIKNRQLTILSGDYFSGHYYLYLAERRNIDLISKWAEAIKVINELKMDLHDRAQQLSVKEKEQLQLEINTKLGTAILDWFQAPSYWYSIYQGLIQLLMMKENAQQNHLNFSELLERMESDLNKFSDLKVLQELKMWLLYIQETQFALEP